ncbi:MAG: TraR/DksA family transcriptional regulator [Gammaproteobacteria bacterium]|nr:TraR/DksA family transcriptional regulator [Gammaproteobacteria bacterium]
MVVDTKAVRERLLARRVELEGRSSQVKADMRHESDPLVADFADQATQRENDEVLAKIGESADAELAQLRRALERLDRGVYETCACCGEAIPVARLNAVPYADRCADCAAEAR